MIRRKFPQASNRALDVVPKLSISRLIQLFNDIFDVPDDPFGRELDRALVRSGLHPSRLQRRPFQKLRLDLFTAIKQTLDRSRARILVVAVENALDRANHDVKRNAAVLPAFDHCPVDRREQKVLPASANERFLDLGEVVVVVQISGRWPVFRYQLSPITYHLLRKIESLQEDSGIAHR